VTSTVDQPPAVPGRRAIGVVVAAAIVTVVAGVVSFGASAGDADGTGAADRRAARSTTTAPPSVRDATRASLVGVEFPVVVATGTNGQPLAVQTGLGLPKIVATWPVDCDCGPMLRAVDGVFVAPPRPLDVVGFVFSADIAATATEVINAGVLFPTAPDAGGEVAAVVAVDAVAPTASPVPRVLVLDDDRTVVAVFGTDVTTEQLRDFVARRFP
jgi:hypothetical protein